MTTFKDIFRIRTSTHVPPDMAVVVSLRPKVQVTVLWPGNDEVETVFLADDYPDGMSAERPIATVADALNPRDVVYILCKPVEKVTIDAVIKGIA